TRAFLRSYAHALSIDSAPLIETYNTYCSNLEQPEDVYSHLKKRRPTPSGLPRIFTVILLLGFFSLAAYYLWEYHSDWYRIKELSMKVTVDAPAPGEGRTDVEEVYTATDEESPIKADQAVGNAGEEIDAPAAALPSTEMPAAPVTVAAAATEVEPKALQEAEESVEELVLEIRASELTWVQIVRDGAPPEQLYLKAGSMIKRKADASFDIIVGNAGGAEVIFQGSSLGPIGNQGEVVSMRLPADGNRQ
ncbi:MAG: DUF4115 domain-containing protein, partial [Syntrophales bacterium]|nr:DUF4115 domain-containing protein [Syntrophales bacterium]